MRLIKLLLAPCFLVLLPSLAFGLGSRIPDQDAEATARADAFTATADNPSAIFYNPAGITQLEGLNSLSSMYGIYINDQYDPLHGEDGAHKSTAHSAFQPVPQFFLTYHLTNSPFAVGLGIYSPFGLKTEWPDDASFRQQGVYGSLEYIAINPVVAVQLTRSLSFAAGFSVNYVDAELRDGLTATEGDSLAFNGRGISAGGNFGILWKPSEQHSFGLSYHTPVAANLKGHTDEGLDAADRAQLNAGNAKIAAGKQKLEAGIAYIDSLPIPPAVKAKLIAQATAEYDAQLAAFGVPASGSFPTSYPTLGAKGTLQFPQYAVLGYSFRPVPDWNIEADIDWTDWDSVNTFSLRRSDGSNVNVPFDWTRSFLYELGVTHTIGLYKLSAGYMYSENSVPSATFNPVIPDSARNLFSVGVGRTFGRLCVDLSYQLGLGGTRTIVNDTTADGRYSFLSNAVSISLGYHF